MLVLTGCIKKQTKEDVDFVSIVDVNNCSSVDIEITVTVHTGGKVEKRGVVFSECPNPILGYSYYGNNNCYSTNFTAVDAVSGAGTFTMNLTGSYYYTNPPAFDASITYYYRPFVVINGKVYYGNGGAFGC